jgi:hypothetical protein
MFDPGNSWRIPFRSSPKALPPATGSTSISPVLLSKTKPAFCFGFGIITARVFLAAVFTDCGVSKGDSSKFVEL